MFFVINTEQSDSGNVLKEMVDDLTWKVGRVLEKLEKHSASPRPTSRVQP